MRRLYPHRSESTAFAVLLSDQSELQPRPMPQSHGSFPKLKALIIDEDAEMTKLLQWKLQKHFPEVTVIKTHQTSQEALESIRESEPDLVFMSIQPGSFRMLDTLGPFEFSLICMSQHDDYALKAIQYGATDYLLYPLDDMSLAHAMEKVAKNKRGHIEEYVQILQEAITRTVRPAQKIMLSAPTSHEFVDVDDILYCESQSNYTCIYLVTKEKITIAKTLKEVEQNLSSSSFFRIHYSYLVNLKHIKKIERGGGHYITLTDGKHLSISKSRKEKFFGQFPRL